MSKAIKTTETMEQLFENYKASMLATLKTERRKWQQDHS